MSERKQPKLKQSEFPPNEFVTVIDHELGYAQCYHRALAERLMAEGKASLPTPIKT